MLRRVDFLVRTFNKNPTTKPGENILIKKDDVWRAAIADNPVETMTDGKQVFCVRVDTSINAEIMIGFTPIESFESNKATWFGHNGFVGAGICLNTGNVHYPLNKNHNIVDENISSKAKEAIAILWITDSGKTKKIQFIFDGHPSAIADVSDALKGDRLYPAICSVGVCHLTLLPIEQVKTRTEVINSLM